MPNGYGYGHNFTGDPMPTQGIWTPPVPGVANPGVDRVLVVDDLARRISLMGSRLYDLVQSTKAHADSLFGPVPETGDVAGANAAPRPPSARLNGLSEAVTATDDCIAMLAHQIERFRAL